MITDHPALVSTSAAVAPAGPVPMMTASQSGVESGTPADFVVRVTARLGVAGALDRTPARGFWVAAILGWAVGAFARVLVHNVAQLAFGGEPAVLLHAVDIGEAAAEPAYPLAIDLLPAAHRAVEFSGRDTQRAFDARAPRQLL